MQFYKTTNTVAIINTIPKVKGTTKTNTNNRNGNDNRLKLGNREYKSLLSHRAYTIEVNETPNTRI